MPEAQPSRPKLTALIPAGDAEDVVRPCLESVRWADEIFVVDSFSKDRTAEIAREYTNRVVQHEYVNSAAQKNWAIPQASHEWVLIVDTDERVTPELRDEIRNLLETGPPCNGYRIRRLNHFMGKPIRHAWANDRCLRLFRRDLGRYQDREVHADVEIAEPVGTLTHPLLHFTARSFEEYMKKFDRYTTWAAGDRARKTPHVGRRHLLLHPVWRFVKQYGLKRGFLDGRAGAVVCGLSAFSAFMKYAKLWERQEAERRKRGEAARR